MQKVLKELIAIFLLFGANSVGHSMQSRLVDPLFSIEYDPAQVHFAPMPTALRETCKGVRRRYTRDGSMPI
ncbi:MAG: hypothetical protein QOD84_71 [Acidobacteriaceae bacterium]|jgi:hypothetical protein